MSDYNHIGTLRRQSDSARKLLKKQGIVPRAIVTDRLKSYAAAKKQVMKNVEHRYSQGIEQPLREFPSPHTSSRAPDAAIQIPRASPTLSFRIWTDSRPLSAKTTSTDRDSAIANSCANDFKMGETLLG